MRRTTILNAVEVRRTTFLEAQNAFYKHCRLKNLRPRTITYYTEDLNYFHSKAPVKYADEITQEVYDDFILAELDAGKKNTSLNTRIRGLRVFFSFCVEREYMKPITAKLMKADEEIKEASLSSTNDFETTVLKQNGLNINYFVLNFDDYGEEEQALSGCSLCFHEDISDILSFFQTHYDDLDSEEHTSDGADNWYTIFDKNYSIAIIPLSDDYVYIDYTIIM